MKKIFLSALFILLLTTAGFCLDFISGDVTAFYIPEYYGKVYDTYEGSGGKSIVYIQDAHCDYTAQKNIVKILKTFVDNYNCKMIAVEGSSGDIDTTLLSSYPDETVKNSISDYFMSTGQMSGAEYFSVKSGKKFFLVGVENKKLYIDNVNDFRSAFSKYGEIEMTIEKLNKGFAVLKQALYSEELKKFTDKMFAFKEETISFSDYFKFLHDSAKKVDVDLTAYPNFYLLVKVNSLKDDIDFESVDSERGHILAVLGNQLRSEELATLLDNSLKFKQKEISYLTYYSYLKDIAKKHDVEDVDNFYTYTRYMQSLNQVNKVALEKEQKDIIDAILDSLYSNKKQGKLFDLDRKFSVLSDLFGLKIDRMDFLFYQSDKKDFRSRHFSKFLNKESSVRNYLPTGEDFSDLDLSVPIAEKFYTTALEREDGFVDNLLDQMDKRNISTAVLIGGGFHTEGVMDKLKKKNISYCVVTPMTSEKQQEVIDAKYVSFVQGKKTSFMSFLDGDEVATEEALPGVIGFMPSFSDYKAYVLALESLFLRGSSKSVDKERAAAFPLDFASKLLSFSVAKGQDLNNLIDEWKDSYASDEEALKSLITELDITNTVVINEILSQYMEGGNFLNELFNKFNINQTMGKNLFPALEENQKLNFVNFAGTDANIVYHFFENKNVSVSNDLKKQVPDAQIVDTGADNFESFGVSGFLSFLAKNIEKFFGDVFLKENCLDKISVIENSIGLSQVQRFDFFTSLQSYLEESIGVNAKEKWGLDINTVLETSDFKIIFDAYLRNADAKAVIFSDTEDTDVMERELEAKLTAEGYSSADIKVILGKMTFTKISAGTIDTIMNQQQVNGLIISNKSVALKNQYINNGVCNYLISEENTSLPVLFNVLSVVSQYGFNLGNLPSVIPQELKDLGIKNTEDLRNLFTSPFPVNIKATVLLDNLHFAREAVARAA